MTLRLLRWIVVWLTLALVGRAHAASENAGTTAANFLTAGAGSAALGMGGATLALGGDLAAATWNPAALWGIGTTQIALSHAGLADDSRQEWVALGGSMGGPAWQWSMQGLFVNSGSIQGRDALNQPTSDFAVSSAAVGGTLGRALGRHAALGIGARWVSDKLGDVTGSGFAFDAGLQARAGLFGIGASARNVGGEMRYDGQGYPFPSNYGVGISFEHPSGIRTAVDMNFPHAYFQDVRAGLEYRWRGTMALRAGYRRELGSDPETEALTGPSFGFGTGSRGMWLDYAFLPSTLGASEHRIALTFAPKHAVPPGGTLGQRTREPIREVGKRTDADKRREAEELREAKRVEQSEKLRKAERPKDIEKPKETYFMGPPAPTPTSKTTAPAKKSETIPEKK